MALTRNQTRKALRLLLVDGICSETMGALTGSAFLVTFALLLGASHLIIGVVSSMAAVAQMLQLAFVGPVSRRKHRRPVAVVAAVAARALWFAIALVWLLPGRWQLPGFLLLIALTYSIGALWKTAFGPWLLTVVPEARRGRYLGRRLSIATGVGAVITLLASVLIGHERTVRMHEIETFSVVFVCAGIIGIVGAWVLGHVPEPVEERQPRRAPTSTLRERLRGPFLDTRYRTALAFLASWNLAVYFAAPFFMVYMLERLSIPVGTAIAFTVLSQIVNVAVMPAWGRLIDRLGERPVFLLSASCFVITLPLWPIVGALRPGMGLLLLALIHVVAGAGAGGVAVAATTLAREVAPSGKLTSYLAARAVASAVPAVLAPLGAGLLGSLLQHHSWTIQLHGLTTLHLRGLDFVFVGAFLLGLYALHRLMVIPGAPLPSRRTLLAELLVELRNYAVESVGGLHHLGTPPPIHERSEPLETDRERLSR